jgi:hypothetical protein
MHGRGGVMEYQDLVQAISTVGFPIVCCCGLFWMINTSMKELKDAIIGLNQSITLMNDRMKREDEAR